MTTVTPSLPVALALPAPGKTARSRPIPLGSWRYETLKRSRSRTFFSLLIASAVHAAIFFGLPQKKPAAKIRTDDGAPTIALVMPQLKELEEPEPVVKDDEPPPPDLGTLAPMLADTPQIPKPGDFVQQLDFSSLLPRPDMGDVKVFTIPEHISRAGKGAGSFVKIFDLSDLDRIPEPLFQPAPIYPPNLRSEGPKATVQIEFIVDPQGRVSNPFVVTTDHPGFNDAALAGVSKWKFRAGVRGGAKVNTRMRVPIVFTVMDAFDKS
jgi:TonB family protein